MLVWTTNNQSQNKSALNINEYNFTLNPKTSELIIDNPSTTDFISSIIETRQFSIYCFLIWTGSFNRAKR